MSANTTKATDTGIDAEGESDSSAGELPLDEVYHLLQSHRRRLTLEYLRGEEGTVDMRDVVKGVAAEEYDTPLGQLDSTERQRVYISLYQRHLPKLDESGVIRYEQDRGEVERTALADQLDEFLPGASGVPGGAPSEPSAREADARERPWERYYGYATVGSLVLLAGAWVNLLPGALASGLSLATIVVGAFLGITIARAVDSGRLRER